MVAAVDYDKVVSYLSKPRQSARLQSTDHMNVVVPVILYLRSKLVSALNVSFLRGSRACVVLCDPNGYN